jgi:hypothetical protein
MTTTPWPYRPYADSGWLGGEHGEDRSLAAIIRSVRVTVSEAGESVTGEPESLLAALTQLAAMAERVDWAMLSLVGEARSHGVPWSGIGTSLGVSKQAAQQRFASYVRQAFDQAANPQGLSQGPNSS